MAQFFNKHFTFSRRINTKQQFLWKKKKETDQSEAVIPTACVNIATRYNLTEIGWVKRCVLNYKILI